MGLIFLPIMLRYGYDRRLASGVIAAFGTLAQIIPPSLLLIILADQLGRSVGDMYKGALVPGLILTGLYGIDVLIVTLIRPTWAPARPKEARTLGHGVTSLLVALVLTAAVGYGAMVWLFCRIWTGRRRSGGDTGCCRRRCRSALGPRHEAEPDGPAGQSGGHRADPAARADLSGVGHDLPWHRHTDRGRCDGRRRDWEGWVVWAPAAPLAAA